MGSAKLNGFNHVATISTNLDRLIAFYKAVFDAEVRFDMHAPGLDLRHVAIEVGQGVFIHAWELREENVTAAGDEMFKRGRLDHLALEATDEEALQIFKERLLAEGAKDVSVTDFGNQLSVWFVDPDGMGLEVCCWKPGAQMGRRPRPAPSGVAHERSLLAMVAGATCSASRDRAPG